MSKLTDKTFEIIKSQVESGMFNDNELRKLSSLIRAGDTSLATVGDEVGHSIVYCDVCGLLCFATNTKVAYNGEYWVCMDCVSKFIFCKSCNTLVLLSDLSNPTHRHSQFELPGERHFPHDQKVAAYNADIMTMGPTPTFFKTPQETVMLRRRIQNQVIDPEKVFRYFGLELEVEMVPGSPPDIRKRTADCLGNQFAILKHDGSLSRHGKGGFEIVSMPGTMAYHKSGVWSQFFKNLGPFFQPQPSTTGLHIHISRNSINPIAVGKMLLFVNSIENREFIFGVANRNLRKPNPNGRYYAGVKEWKASDLLRLKQHNPDCPWHQNNKNTFNYYEMINGTIKTDAWGNPVIASVIASPNNVRKMCRCPEGMYNIEHYEAVNLRTHRPTVELRIFRGIINESFLYACLEFADALIDFCGKTRTEDLLYRNFLNYVTNRQPPYGYLYQMLVNQCWIDPPKEKSAPKIEQVSPYGMYA